MKFPVLWLSFVSVWAGTGKLISIARHFYAKAVEKKDYDRIIYELGSDQLITVHDYNWITITLNNPLGVVWSNYGAWLNKMAGTWWFERKKLLIALWSEEILQHELNNMHNKKLVWNKISQGMADGGYSRSARQCHVKISNLKQKKSQYWRRQQNVWKPTTRMEDIWPCSSLKANLQPNSGRWLDGNPA